MKWFLIIAAIVVAVYFLRKEMERRKEEERVRLRRSLAITKRVGSERGQY